MTMNEPYTHVAYIDEAGDEGFGKLRQVGGSGQSNWLALGAALVSVQNDRFMPSWRDEIIGLFPKKKHRDLHFRNLSHDQKVAACSILSTKPIGVCIIASCKVTILDSDKLEIFKRKGHLYNYLIRFLLERVTDAVGGWAKTQNRRANLKVVFSRRGGTNYQSVNEYLMLMRDGKEVVAPIRGINWDVLHPDSIQVENHSMRAGLQIADVVTSATYSALDPNQYGNIEPRYAMLLKQRLLKRNRRILNCGLTLIPRFDRCPLSQEQQEFIENINRSGRPPEP